MATKTNDTHPGKDFSAITQLGYTAQTLATTHKAVLEPRLPTGMLTKLSADLVSLGKQLPGAKQVRVEAQVATVGQGVALDHGYKLVTALRTTVARSEANAEVQRAYGVGVKVSPRVVKDVKSAITLIVDRATKEPTEATALGILAKDVAALIAASASLTGADADQEKQRADAPLSTKERNATARRIMSTVDRIVGAGVVEFAHSPTERASFEALIGKGNRSSKKSKPKAKAAPAKPSEPKPTEPKPT